MNIKIWGVGKLSGLSKLKYLTVNCDTPRLGPGGPGRPACPYRNT